ncbi:hypothetical protein COCOBI_15-4330 [Coccomyxa sp. Obi]|nr:hypothetical protein COCOBI_15-4330 [Coccomyxa sp. Obi]
MRAVVESHDLVIEAGQLHLTTRAHTLDEDLVRLKKLRGAVETSGEGAMLEKAAPKLIKAALLHHGISVHIPLALLQEFSLRILGSWLVGGFRPLEEDETAEQRAQGLSWLHLVTSVPLIMWQIKVKMDCKGAIATASIALALLAEEGRNWESLLEMHGLTMWDVELVLRMHLSQALLYFRDMDLPLAERTFYRTSFIDNATCVYKREPTHPVNVNFFIEFCSGELACLLLRIVIGLADKRGDHQIGSMMRWHLCYIILTGGEGQVVSVAKILKLVKEAQTAMEQAARWGADSPMTPAKAPATYWPCLGFAARCKAAIKAVPSFAQSTVDAFESPEVLDREKRHVMCAQCASLSDKLQKCGDCELVDYCSKECQVKHWKAGHKRACRGRQAPAKREHCSGQ